MTVMVEGYAHRTGEHCASTALRNILSFRGVNFSEEMIFGLSSGLGFFYIQSHHLSPTRMFHGRTMTLESDFSLNTQIPFEDRPIADDDQAWTAVREQIDAGLPVMVSTDTFYLRYHNTTSHFPGHRAVVVGYDDTSETIYLADRKFDAYQSCSFEELKHSRNAPDYPMSCNNQFGDFQGDVKLGVSIDEAILAAMRRNANGMLTETDSNASGVRMGVDGIRTVADDLPDWHELEDWSWASRFGYQIVIKRGAGGSFFRSLYASFLEEAAEYVPDIATARLPQIMTAIAARWRDLATLLKEQSERESCEPALFTRAGEIAAELADAEHAFFTSLREVAD
ncbi:MAG: BtrH N-terminal domain-containing protein [bacterium]|nr:BtrH N-terminal domain-containing protein [bacterium]